MNKSETEQRKLENAQLRRDIEILLINGKIFLNSHFEHLNIIDYKYDISVAVEALGLDKDLVYQLVEDYIIQILKSEIYFNKYIETLKQSSLNNEIPDYEDLRNLAHKNLGVARNLHIDDAQILLTILMKNDDLDYLSQCVKALEITASKMIPLCAYETLKLIAVKNSL